MGLKKPTEPFLMAPQKVRHAAFFLGLDMLDVCLESLEKH